ncbi:unnamed protein product [Amaranthus hypochondriacus]
MASTKIHPTTLIANSENSENFNSRGLSHCGGPRNLRRGGRTSCGNYHSPDSQQYDNRSKGVSYFPSSSRPNRPFPPWSSWAQSHCPTPTTPWNAQRHHSHGPSSAASLLGPCPAQNFCLCSTSSMGYLPTDVDQAMNTLSFSSSDEQFYMDTGATSHMTRSQGTLTSYSPLKHHFNNAIIVGDGNMISVHGHGHISFPTSQKSLTLKNVLHAPKLIKNLISVRKFTRDKMVSVEFDPFGFSVKDLATGNIVLRSNSTGDLYPFQSTHGASSSSLSSSSAFSTFSTSIWHSRLGHPGHAILNSLSSSSFIKCNKDPSFVCHSCPLGKHIQLPFMNSMSMSDTRAYHACFAPIFN